MSTPLPTAPHRRADDHRGTTSLDLRKLFLTALLIGAIGIFAGQWLGNIIIAVSLPLAVMALYMALGFYRGTADVIVEQFADSIYYLGFLFTLLALVVSLYAFRADSLAIGQLVGNFALALVTTITGLAARIIITNFRSDEGSARRALRDELEQSTHDLVLNARSFSLRLEALNNEVHFTLNSALQEASRNMAATVDALQQQQQDSAAAINRSVSEAGETLTQTVQRVQQQLAAIELPQDIFSARLHQPLEQLTQRFGDQQVAIDALMEQHDSVLQRALRVNQGLQGSADKLATLEQSLDGLGKRIAEDERAHQHMLQLGERMTALLEQQQQLSAGIDQQADSARRATTGLQALVGDIDSARQHIGSTTEALNRGGQALGRAVDSFSDDAERGQAIATSVGEIAAAFEQARVQVAPIAAIGSEIGDHMQRHAQRFAELEKLGEAQLAMLQQHQQQLEQVLAESRDTLRQVNDHFIDAARYVSQRLGPDGD